MNKSIVADPDKCIGCRTCEIACVLAHAPKDVLTSGSLDQHFTPRLRVVKAAVVTVPVQCRQCEDAPCANVCPSKAIVNKEDTIYIKAEACIGCKNCIMACPYGGIDLVPQVSEGEKQYQSGLKVVERDGIHDKERIVALKCDLCIHRPEGPACANVCPTQAFKPIEGATMARHIKKRRLASAEELSRLAFKQ
ncbi:MAG: oxidoreductase fe-s binding subunit [Firmicutes bacterium]|nr:oxidoreductase fe-s binding subunit [Bacillota bacterium]